MPPDSQGSNLRIARLPVRSGEDQETMLRLSANVRSALAATCQLDKTSQDMIASFLTGITTLYRNTASYAAEAQQYKALYEDSERRGMERSSKIKQLEVERAEAYSRIGALEKIASDAQTSASKIAGAFRAAMMAAEDAAPQPLLQPTVDPVGADLARLEGDIAEETARLHPVEDRK